MRFIIDDKLERVIVSDGFFNEIDRMNKIIKARGGNEIDYVQHVRDAIEKAMANPLVRKSDVPGLRK